MAHPTDLLDPAPVRRPGRAVRITWRAGWALLALTSTAGCYVALVHLGR
ncbi:hypothetical protein ACIRBZ_11735 [Streptomyces sp. NPDC094038]